jgi:CO/xanthine dehydrogenase Mo-binding subunit
MVLRTAIVGRSLTRIDLSVLPSDLQPFKIVTAADLSRDGFVFPNSDLQAGVATPSLFAAVGSAPQFLGQPVAILLFKNCRTYVRAHGLLQFNESVLKYAEASSPPEPQNPSEGPAYAPPTYLTRYADGTGERFSQVMNSFTNPYSTTGARASDREAAHWRKVIESELQSGDWRIFHGEYDQRRDINDVYGPESGLGWLETGRKTLHLLVGTQSSNGCVADTLKMFGAQGCAYQINTIVLNACYPGGGFGGRDKSNFPTLLAIAAAYSPKPVRIAYDRFEQFQSGLKQLGANISQKLAIDSEGRFQAIVGKYELLAGGRNNYSQWVAQLAGYCGGGGYAIPRVSIDAEARASIGVIAGSMRGFGGPQAAFAVESLVDEAAIELKTDPIELRQRNALAKGGYTVTGFCIPHSVRIAEICERARRNPLWTERDHVRQEYSGRGMLYGVGFALVNKAFGTGSDGVMASVDSSPDGSIGVTTNCVDMGNGSATSLAISTAVLGANATRIQLGEVTLFNALQITNKPYNSWSNPQYTPVLSMSSSSCITAFHQVHAVEQACRVLLENAIWPAARVLWNRPTNEPFDATKVSWVNGALAMPGHQPLPLFKLCRALHDGGGIVGAMIHASYLGRWIEASFPLDNRDWKGQIDALAIRKAGDQN